MGLIHKAAGLKLLVVVALLAGANSMPLYASTSQSPTGFVCLGAAFACCGGAAALKGGRSTGAEWAFGS